MADQVESKFHVSVIPVVTDVEKSESTNAQAAESIPFNLTSSTTPKSQGTMIKLRPDWAMVATHPVFGQEYKKYIRTFQSRSFLPKSSSKFQMKISVEKLRSRARKLHIRVTFLDYQVCQRRNPCSRIKRTIIYRH